ncbi:MFS transporter [Aquitalea palustris]|uniref:MFS transporter n=1 Tax=Aquitalea palustris TaxID=2480983 RepID=A0A454JGW0_9NEIS|nr:MFS transporter [Aquitalea palustris]RMC95967.1 MFS transporter [Aquitalea palustris]
MNAYPVLLQAHPECRPWQVRLFGLTLGLVTGADFVAVSMMGVAGAAIQGGVAAAPQEYLWALTSFAVGAVLVNLLLGRFATLISYRRYTQWALLLFMAGSVGCALAEDITSLALARLLQGLGGGGLFTASRILLQLVAQPKERKPLMYGFLLGLFSLSGISPWLSALLVEDWGWQAIFWLQAAFVPVLLLLVQLSYPRHAGAPTRAQAGELDWVAVAAVGLGALLVLHTLEDLRFLRFAARPGMWLALLGGALLLGLAWRRSHTHPDPWLQLHALLRRRYLMGLAFYVLYYLCNGIWSYLLSSLLQRGLGFDFVTTGWAMSMGSMVTVAMALAYLYASRWLTRRHHVLAIGFALLALCCLWLAGAAMPGAALASLLPAILLHGLVPVLSVLQIAAMTYAEVQVEDFAHAYQLKNIMRELAGALGTGLATLQLQAGEAEARLALLGRLDGVTLRQWGEGVDAASLARLSAQVTQQTVLIACDHALLSLAALAGLALLLSLWQRDLR